ncbi:hypothetical protein NPX79_00995 [Spiroplasma endosymbiont of Anurida maritima]|uniref:hypothetical protein n=1 Tax=Spiroplasma endosymbiont of Anurida maritima TaxID=2967972 RepID=UPI0036D43047
MKSIYDQLELYERQKQNNSFRIISKELLKDFFTGNFRSQSKLANDCYMSPSTITYFSKSLNLSGYREMIVRLKVEYENHKFKSNSKNDESNFIEFESNNLKQYYSAIKWLKNNNVFLESLINEIKKTQKIVVFTSNQIHSAASFWKELMYDVKDLQLEIINPSTSNINFFDKGSIWRNRSWTKLFIVSGRDIRTITKMLENTNEKNIYAVLPKNLYDNFSFENRIPFDLQGDDYSLSYRHIAVEAMLTFLTNKLT